jgi:hypothetical protein
MATLEYVRVYIDDLLVITKGSLDDHLDKLKQVFIRLRNAGLKINATKSGFCAQETEYLGYILTTSEVQSKMIFMGHQILSCHVPVVRSFFHLVKDVVIILKSSI